MGTTKPPETITLPFNKLRLSTPDYALIIGLVILLFAQYSTLSDLKQLPSPLYGGDQYFHYGHVLHLYQGGSPFESSHYLDEYEHYPWITHLVIAILSWILFLNPLSVTLLWFPLFTTLLACVFSYLLGKKIFSNRWLPVLFSFYWITLLLPNLGPSMIAQYVMLPLLALSWLHWEHLRNRVWAGVAYGLVGLQHATLFIGTSFYFALRFIYDYVHSFVHLEKSKLRIYKKHFGSELITHIKRYLPIFVIGVAIALLYWWAPLLVYQGKTLNPWQEYSGQGVSSLTPGIVISGAYHTIATFNNTLEIITSLLAILGLYYTFRRKQFNPAWIFWGIGILGLAHPFITQPLLGTSFGYYRFSLFLSLSRALFLFYGAQYLIESFNKKKTLAWTILFALLLVTLLQGYQTLHTFEQDPFTKTARENNPYLQGYIHIGEWVAKNTDPHKATLSSHGETAFAYHSVSGNKVVSLRRTHANPYAHENKRIADSAIMLYGNNTPNARALLHQYQVSYLFEDAQSVQNRAICSGLWENFTQSEYVEQSYSCLQTSPEFANSLQENGIEYQLAHVRLDVSNPNAPRFDMLLIKPKDLHNFDLKPLQQITVGERSMGALFEIQTKTP